MNNKAGIKVWDPVVRLFHWTLIIAFTAAYFTEGEWQNIHVWSGYVVLALLVLRIIWGFFGTRYARFADFFYTPGEIMGYLKSIPQGKAVHYIGHNPAGGAMIIALICSLSITTITGVAYYGADQWLGPLAETMKGIPEFWVEILEETHEFFANFTLFLITVHVIGVISGSFLHRENLVLAMINGSKRA